MRLTRMVTDCGGRVQASGTDAAVGAGILQELIPIFSNVITGETVAARAQHGMPAKIGVSIAITHSLFFFAALHRAPSFCHMTTTSVFPYIVIAGLTWGERIGSMYSL